MPNPGSRPACGPEIGPASGPELDGVPDWVPGVAAASVAMHLHAAADGEVAVVHRGEDAIYLDVAGMCVGVLSRRAWQVPNGIGTRVSFGSVGVRGEHARIEDGCLVVDGVPIRVGRVVSFRAPRIAAHLAPLPTPALPDGWPGQSRVADLVGRGPGLTPLGDDILAGMLATRWAAGEPDPGLTAEVLGSLSRTTLLSATLLHAAINGDVIPEFGRYLRAIGGPGESAAAGAVAGIGATSGVGLLAGAGLAFAQLNQERKVA